MMALEWQVLVLESQGLVLALQAVLSDSEAWLQRHICTNLRRCKATMIVHSWHTAHKLHPAHSEHCPAPQCKRRSFHTSHHHRLLANSAQGSGMAAAVL